MFSDKSTTCLDSRQNSVTAKALGGNADNAAEPIDLSSLPPCPPEMVARLSVAMRPSTAKQAWRNRLKGGKHRATGEK